MNTKHLRMIIVMAVALMLGNVSAGATDEVANVRHLSGNIEWISVKKGNLHLKSDMPQNTGEITEYRINNNNTRVTDPTDQKFLTIDNLQVGQHIVIDVINGHEDQIVQKIVADPYVAAESQETTKTTVTTTTTTVKE